MTHVIDIAHLQKSFGAVHAVQDLSFHVRKGELFAFLGVNGAGKSTTIHILCGQLRRDGGDVAICGLDPDDQPDAVRQYVMRAMRTASKKVCRPADFFFFFRLTTYTPICIIES